MYRPGPEDNMKRIGCRMRILRFIKENISYLVTLLATFLALALLVGMTFGSFYHNAKESAVEIGNMKVTDEVRRIDNALLLGLNTLQMTTINIEYMMEEGVSTDVMEQYLVQESEKIRVFIDQSFLSSYGVVKGVYIDGNNWQPGPEYDPFDRPWYHVAKEKQGELAIVSPYVDAETGSVIISYCTMLSDGESVISIDKSMDNIYHAAEQIQLNGKGYCFIVDNTGLVVAHRDEAEIGKNYLADSPDGDMQRLLQRIFIDDSDVIEMQLDGKDSMVFSESVQNEWYVVLVVERDDVFADMRGSLRQIILVSLAIFILVGYFCTSNYFNQKKAIRYANDVRTDNLTGLNNRGECDRYLHTTTSSISTDKQLYLLIFDADDFKAVNDRFGHIEGDKALRHIADALKAVCHDTDWFCARYGGDEFVIICKCLGEETVHTIIAKVAAKLNEIAEEYDLPYELSLSCGFAKYEPEGQTVAQLIDVADQALYQMKAQRKQANMSDRT